MIPGIELSHEEWLFAPWRPRTVLPRPVAQPFVAKEAIRRLLAVGKAWRFSPWNHAQLSGAMSREEAIFWLRAMIILRDSGALLMGDELKIAAAKWDLNTPPDQDSALCELRKGKDQPTAALVLLERVYSWPAVLEFLSKLGAETQIDESFRIALLPYATEDELTPLRELVRALLATGRNTPLVYGLAGLLNIPDAIHLKTPSYAYSHPERRACFGLRAEDVLLRAEWLVGPRGPEEIITWIAHTGTTRLDWIVNSLVRRDDSRTGELVTVMAERLSGPEAAPHFLALLVKSRGKVPAERWLRSNPERTRMGLEGYDWNQYPFWRATLRKASAKLLASFDEKPAQPVAPVAADAIPDSLAEQLREAKSARWKVPKWLVVDEVPAIQVNGGAVESAAICAALNAVPLEPLGRSTLCAELRQHADPDSLDAFAIALLDQWRMNGAAFKDRWPVAAIGLLGSERAAFALYALLPQWADRASLRGLAFQALARIDAPSLLWHTRKLHDDRLASTIALATGESLDQLLDRTLPPVPALIFDYGVRKFNFALDSEAQPLFIEESGERHARLPKPKKSDDATLAEKAQATAKEATSDHGFMRRYVLKRLEEAFRKGFKWPMGEFELVLQRHAIFVRLMRLIVWAAFDHSGNLIGAFRLNDDGTYSDSSDTHWKLPAEATHISIPHGEQMSEADRTRWLQLFADYQMVPLLPQFEQSTWDIPKEFRNSTRLPVFSDRPRDALLRHLYTLGYRVEPKGMIWYKHLENLDVTIAFQSAVHGQVRIYGDVWFIRISTGLPMRLVEVEESAIKILTIDLEDCKLSLPPANPGAATFLLAEGDVALADLFRLLHATGYRMEHMRIYTKRYVNHQTSVILEPRLKADRRTAAAISFRPIAGGDPMSIDSVAPEVMADVLSDLTALNLAVSKEPSFAN